jgi:RNA polymerase sigma factor (sigma-70 family)
MDLKLLKRCMQGDSHAQGQLYRTYSAKMFAVCLRYMQRHQLAEDVLQEGFVKVFLHINTYKGTGDFEGWMRKIFVNTSLEAIRRDKKFNSWDEIECAQSLFTQENAVSALNALSVAEIMQAIADVPSGLREVFNLYAIDGYSHKEIADMLGISEANSKQRLSRARAQLQQIILDMNKVPQQ